MYGGSGASPAGSPSSRSAPAALAEVLEQLDGTQPLAGPEPPRRPRERLPGAVAVQRLEQQHLRLAPALAAQPQPGGDDPRVVDDDELAGELVRQLREPPVADPPVRRSKTSSRDSSRGSTGCWAISSAGSS